VLLSAAARRTLCSLVFGPTYLAVALESMALGALLQYMEYHALLQYMQYDVLLQYMEYLALDAWL